LVDDYSTEHELLILNYPNGDSEVYFFGEADEEVRLLGLAAEDLKGKLDEAAEESEQRIKWLGEDGPILFLDGDGNEVRRFSSLSELQEFHRIESESFDHEALLERLRVQASKAQSH
jgi:hypothetical protein